MTTPKKIALTLFKKKLLEYVREVEKGQNFEITKNGEVVALFSAKKKPVPVTGFYKVDILGSLELNESWSYDQKIGSKIIETI